jgi:hypothetical protein
MKMTNFTKTLMFPVVLLSCIGGVFVAWCGTVVATGLLIPWTAWKILVELYREDGCR